MGCCNEKRASWGKAVAPTRSATSVAAETTGPTVRELPMSSTMGFEYVGETALSVFGPITRTHYRFRGNGAQVEVDHRDAPYVSGVPSLRRVRKNSLR